MRKEEIKALGRLDGLDALRGVAALCVVFQHAMEHTVARSGLFWPLLHTINLGRFGVLLFFLISGFVIPPSLERIGLRSFAINRAFRLLPALWLSVALGAAILFVDRRPFSGLDVLANMAMLAWPLGMVQFFGHYWSLTCELGFYGFCAALFAIRGLRNFRLIATLAIWLATLGGMVHSDTFVYPSYLLLGILVRRAFDGAAGVGPWIVVIVATLAYSGVAVSIHSDHPMLLPLPKSLGMLLPIPVFLITIRWITSAPRSLIWLGEISYSVYLFHAVALWILMPISASPVLYVACVISLALAIGAGVYQTVERPGIAAGRSLQPRPGRVQAVAVP